MKKQKGILPHSHYVTIMPIFILNSQLAEYTNSEVQIQNRTDNENCSLCTNMGKFNVPCEVLIGNMLHVKIVDIKYDGMTDVEIIYDKLNT